MAWLFLELLRRKVPFTISQSMGLCKTGGNEDGTLLNIEWLGLTTCVLFIHNQRKSYRSSSLSHIGEDDRTIRIQCRINGRWTSSEIFALMSTIHGSPVYAQIIARQSISNITCVKLNYFDLKKLPTSIFKIAKLD